MFLKHSNNGNEVYVLPPLIIEDSKLHQIVNRHTSHIL